MKTIIPGLLLVLLSFASANAQKIHFTDTSNQWKVHNDGGGTEYYSYVFHYHFGADTFLNGHDYKKLSSTETKLAPATSGGLEYDPASAFYFREDTLQHVVYCYDISDSIETVIYDGNWQVGDFIKVAKAWNQSYPYFVTLAVTAFVRAIDSTNINGQWYKVFHFNPSKTGQMATDIYSIIEGVGSTSGPWLPAYPETGVELSWSLRCFQSGLSTPPASPAVIGGVAGFTSRTFNNTTSCTLGVPTDKLYGQKVTVVPNPVNSSAILRFAKPISKGTVVIHDAFGRLIFSSSINAVDDVSIGAYLTVPGIYFYKVSDERNSGTYTGKIVCQ